MVFRDGCKIRMYPCIPGIGIGRAHYEASSMMIEALKDANFDKQSDIETYITKKLMKAV